MGSSAYLTWGHPNTDELLATTTSAWLSTEAYDNIFNATPLLKSLYGKKKTQEGGASIIIPLMFEGNDNGKWYDKYDTLNTKPQAGFTASQAKWKNYATTIEIDGPTARQNLGKNQMINLLRAKTTQAEASLKKDITTALVASSVSTNYMSSMPVIMDATSTIQDINSTTYSWWQANVDAAVGSFASNGLTKMRTAFTTIAKYTPEGVIDNILTTDTVYNYYEGSLTPQLRYSSGTEGNASFETLKFKNATIYYDNQCPSGSMFMWPSSNLFLVVNSAADMKKTEFIEPYNQDAKVAKILLQIQLCTNSRRKLYKLSGITA